MQRSSVDLPEPDGPITQVTVPRWTSRSTPARTRRLPKLLWTSRRERIAPLSFTASPGSAVVGASWAEVGVSSAAMEPHPSGG